MTGKIIAGMAEQIEARDAEIARLENVIAALKNDVSTATVEIDQLREECRERRDEWARTRAAAERMAKALDAVPTDPRAMWNYDAWREARASAAAFRVSIIDVTQLIRK